MLDKYIGKNVEVLEKLYSTDSTIKMRGNKITGMVTAIDNNFIELDNKILINIKHIYIITIL